MMSPQGRFIALVLALVLVITFATPAKAEADVTTILAIIGAAVGLLVIIAYLVVANVEGKGMADSDQVRWAACSSAGCTAIDASTAQALMPPAPMIDPVVQQGP